MKHKLLATAMYGLLIGDALGVPYEFHKAEEIPQWQEITFEPPPWFERSYLGIPPGTWSDDGAQALCLLDSLKTCGRLDLEDLANRLLAWADGGLWAVDSKVFDCGIQTMRSLRAFANGESPRQSGFTVPDGKGNGSLMRVLPLALWHGGSDEELACDAPEQSLVTHGHVCNQVCCAFYCLWARYIAQGLPPLDAYKKANIFLQGAYRQKEAYLYELECCTAEGEATGTGYVVDSIRSTFYLLRKYSKYADVVRGAIALGNDTDTTAAIAGGLAAIAYKDISRQWLEHLRGREEIQRLLPEQPITQ